jgi:hypothetical protein
LPALALAWVGAGPIRVLERSDAGADMVEDEVDEREELFITDARSGGLLTQEL